MTETIDTANLRALAEAATPGPWIYFPKPKYQEHHVSIPLPDSGMRLALFDDGCPTGAPDAQYIAAANPATIIALLDALAAAEARNATLTDDAARYRFLRDMTAAPSWYAAHVRMGISCEVFDMRLDAEIARAAASISTKGDGRG